MNAVFSGASVEECIEKASKDLNVPIECLKYEITKDKKQFFKRIVEIKIIEVLKQNREDVVKVENSEKDDIKINHSSEKKIDFGAKVDNGRIIVNDFEDENTLITIEPCKEVILLINGNECDFKTPVDSTDKIEYKFAEQEAVRDVQIEITTNRLEAYLSINYVPQSTFILEDAPFEKNLKLRVKKNGEKYPPKFSVKELQDLLYEKGIRNGILEDELKKIAEEYNVEKRLVAKGIEAEDDIPDKIKLYFNDKNELIDYNVKDTKVNYRNRYLISNAVPGDILAEFIPGSPGNDGIDVLGLTIRRKPAKKLFLKAGENCTFENNKVICNVEGRPAMKGNTVIVNRVYKLEQVDIKSGNVNFVGNVEVAKNVEEGMKVVAGGELYVGKNIESAEAQASRQIIVNGNVLSSTVKSGAENVEIKTYINTLIEYKDYVEKLIDSTEQLRAGNLLGKSRYGEIIKLLIENKYKQILELSKKILNYNNSNDMKENEITSFVRQKMIGLGPLKIEDVEELQDFRELLEMEIDEMESSNIIAADVYIDYAQGAKIEASGNLYITGKGQYTSNMLALGNIEFTAENSVCRGGELISGNEIKLQTVGSTAGVSTVLRVPKNGKITAKIAYSNTLFCFGERQLLLETPSKDLIAYLDKKDDIIVEKFVL